MAYEEEVITENQIYNKFKPEDRSTGNFKKNARIIINSRKTERRFRRLMKLVLAAYEKRYGDEHDYSILRRTTNPVKSK